MHCLLCYLSMTHTGYLGYFQSLLTSELFINASAEFKGTTSGRIMCWAQHPVLLPTSKPKRMREESSYQTQSGENHVERASLRGAETFHWKIQASLSKPYTEKATRINIELLLFFYLLTSSNSSQTHKTARELYMVTFQGRISDGEERKVDL